MFFRLICFNTTLHLESFAQVHKAQACMIIIYVQCFPQLAEHNLQAQVDHYVI